MRKGYTLVEAIIVVAILTVLMMTVTPFLRTTHISWEKDKELSNILQNARYALDKISNELKYTNEIVEIDPNYVKFGTYQDEIYFDDRNAGHTYTGVWSSGTSQGGYAGDWLVSNTQNSTSRWQFNTILEGEYEIYVWYVAQSTNSNSVGYSVFDDGINEANYTVDQRINGSRWYKLGTVNLTNGGTDYLQMTVPAGGSFAVADGVKLVYKGYDHKEFSFVKQDPTPSPYDESHKIFYRAASKTNAETYLLLDNVYLVNEGKPDEVPLFQYFQMDGQTPATTPGDVAIIRISFEIRSPYRSVAPYRLSTSVYRNISPKERRLVINEINIQTPEKVIGFDNFDGTINNMDTDNFGWATETQEKDYGWYSVVENFNDMGDNENGNNSGVSEYGWFAGTRGEWDVENDTSGNCTTGQNCIFNGTGNGSTDQRNNAHFYESSANFKWEFRYRVVAQGAAVADQFGGATKTSTFGVYVRAEDPTGNNNNLVYVEFLRKGGNPFFRVAKYEGGAYRNISGDVSFSNTFDNGQWHSIKIYDMWGKIHIFYDGTRVSHPLGYCYNSTSSCANSQNQTISNANLVPQIKGLFVWSNTHIHFDDLIIISYDFKPIAYLSDFEGIYNDWFTTLYTAGYGSCGWQIGTPHSEVGGAYSGEKVAATNPFGDYPTTCDESLYRRCAIDTSPSEMRWSFPFVHFFTWQKYPLSQTLDCTPACRGDTSTRYYVDEPNVFPLDESGRIITSTYNNFSPPPSSYDATCTHPVAFYNLRRMWTNPHTSIWTEISYLIPEQNYNNDVCLEFPFGSGSDADVSLGHYIDSPSIYPGGLWERVSAPAGPGRCYGGSGWCWATHRTGDYSNYQSIGLETPTVITPAWTYEINLSWVQWRDFEGTVSFYDGGFLEYSLDNGKTWTQVTSDMLSVAYDMCEIGSDPGTSPPDTCTLQTPGYLNELQGYEGWTMDDRNWREVSAIITGDNLKNKELKFRFRFGSDGSNDARGWFIDNIKISVAPKTGYEWIEIYNPTPHPVDVGGWRIILEHSYQDTPNPYDTISGDTVNGSGSTIIGPYGYAIITSQGSSVYDGKYFNLPPESPSARRLVIDDDTFGTLGLRFKFGKIKLTDSAGRLVDEVDYNLVFYDDMESYQGAYSDYWRYTYSVQDWGNSTHFAVGTPISSAGPGRDYTLNSPGKGEVWFLCTDPLNTQCEDYVNRHETALVLPALNLVRATSSNPPFIEFYLWNNVTDTGRRDGLILEVSLQGGADFVQDPPAPNPLQIPGTSLFPGYHTRTINDAANVLNGLFAYSRDIRTWTKITGDLSQWAGNVINLRFLFGAGNATTVGGCFLDNIAVYYDWADLDSNWDKITEVLSNSLERVVWMADSNNPLNWKASQAPYNSPPNIGTPNRKNSVSP